VVDTTGAGDAFVAAFVRARLDGAAADDAARAGCAAGALATRALGAQSSLATRAELEELLGAAAPATRSITVDSSSVRARDALAPTFAPTLARCADGWRGMIGVSFTVDGAAELATAIAAELRERQGAGTLLIAPDGRAESEEAARAVADAVRACGLACESIACLPPPVVNFAIRRHNLLGALVITASHNASGWNGVKLKVAPGTPPSRQLERAIEARRGRARRAEPRTVEAEVSGGMPVSPDLASLFADVLLERVKVDAVRSRRPRVIVDGLHGIAGAVMARALAGAGCDVRLIGGEPDPMFGGLLPDPMSAHSRERVVDAVRAQGADLGLVLDGDGDRLGVVDDRGEFVWPHDVLALLVRHCDSRDHRAGRVAVTSPTGSIVGRVARALGRSVVETPVGFKHIAPFMRRQALLLGGGSVGDIGCRGFGFDRDPFAAALLLLELLAVERRPLSRVVRDLHAAFGSSSYAEATIDASGLADAELEAIGRRALRAVTGRASDVTVSHVDGVKLRLPDDRWLLLRNATTDAVVRVHAETSASDDLALILGELQDSVSGAHP
jgi:phosphomannomutase